MMSKLNHRLVMELYCLGMGDLFSSDDPDLPVSTLRRLFWRMRGALLMRLFGWWKWKVDDALMVCDFCGASEATMLISGDSNELIEMFDLGDVIACDECYKAMN